MPKVSVIIPVCNVEPYLQQCLESVINQTLRDIEIICVDDASSDNSVKIVQDYCQKDSRIQLYTFNERKSALLARKQGIFMAKGSYILFLDADDYLENFACEELYDKITEEKVEILHFNSIIENCGNIDPKRIEMNKSLLRPFEGKLHGKEIFSKCFKEERYGFTLWNKLFSTDLCKRAAIYMGDEYLPKAQDMYAYFIIAYLAKSYLGWNSQYYHHYCFGRGVTGSNVITLDVFKRYCLQANVIKELRRFSDIQKMDENNEDIISKYEGRWLNECIDLWYNRIESKNSTEAFQYLFKNWNIKKILITLAGKYWYNRDLIAKKIGNLEKPTIMDTEIKTIALYYYHFTIGGVQRVISLLIPLFLQMGYRVIFITDKEPSKEDILLSDNVERIIIPDYQKIDKSNYNLRLDKWEKIIEQYSIDLVIYHAWTSPLLLWDMLFLKLHNIPVVVQTHSIFSYSLISMNRDFGILPHVMSLCDGMIVLSEADKVFWENFNGNVHHIPNPINPDLINAEKSKGEENLVIWVGRFSEEKQPWEAINIIEEVVKRNKDVQLYMIGDSSDATVMKKYKKMVEHKSLTENIKFLGYQNDVNKYFSRAAVNLITSVYEGYSMTLLEAQAHGVPTVMYDMPYLDLSKPEYGVLSVTPGDNKFAAIKILQLINNEQDWNITSKSAENSFKKCIQYNYQEAWRKIFSGERQILVENKNNNKIMLETILSHYLVGWTKKYYGIKFEKGDSCFRNDFFEWFKRMAYNVVT